MTREDARGTPTQPMPSASSAAASGPAPGRMTRGSTRLPRSAPARSQRLLCPPPKKSERSLRSPSLTLGRLSLTKLLLVDRLDAARHHGCPELGVDPEPPGLAETPSALRQAEDRPDRRREGEGVARRDQDTRPPR